MADLVIQTHYISSGLGGGPYYLTGQYIRVIGNGSSIRAELWTAGTGGSYIAQPSGGPDLSGDGITVATGSFLNPQYCSGEDLIYYTVKSVWPYADYHISVDNPSCAILVCDLEITAVSSVNETTTGASDGQISGSATSSNGAIKFSLTPGFAYVDGQDLPITGIGTGNYVLYARDVSGCTDQVTVFVGIDYTYGVRWRMEYDHVYPIGYRTRIDIKQRDYSGEIEETCGGGTPFRLDYNPEEDSQLVSSVATIELIVEDGQEGKFSAIREGDDRQHIVEKFLDSGSGFVLDWTGYVSSEFYQEPYIFEPYVIELQAIDGLKELYNKPFVMASGENYFGNMSLIQIISECLKKLQVSVEVRSCLNIFEENMETEPEDDPLAQTIIRSERYRDDTCGDVISKIIEPFTGAEMFQSHGVWWIRTREQAVDTVLNYRVFNADGEYVSNDSISARTSLGFPTTVSRMSWTDKKQTLRYSRPYGKVTIVHDLDKDNNMIDTGGFEVVDIDPSTEFFRGWHFFPLQGGMSSGLEYVDNGESKGAFFVQWQDVDDQQLNSLASDEMPISIGSDFGTGSVYENTGTSFKIKFSVYASPSYNVSWIWFGWKLRFTDVDTNDFWDWWPTTGGPIWTTPDVNEERINSLYISEFNSWKTYEFLNFRFPGPATAENFKIQLTFYFHNHKGKDSASTSELKTFVTANSGNSPSNEGRKVYSGAVGISGTVEYTLQKNTESEDLPNIVRPDDYNAISNPYQWIKTNEFNVPVSTPLLEKILIDNVSISMFSITPNLEGPGFFLIDPPETITYEETITDRNESALTAEVVNGDAPPMVGADYIYNGFFKLADGTYTKNWFRTSVPDERQKLLQIYLGYLTAQGSLSKRLLSGSGVADIQIGYINSMVDQIDDRKYRFVRFSFDDKRGLYDFELEETLVGDDGESPPTLGEFSNEFSDDFNV